MTFPAHSIHSWRQADCLSLSKNFTDNNNPFTPSIHNYISDDQTSGKSAGEFTGMYFIIGKIWGITGVQLWIYRLVNLFLLGFACFSLFKTLQKTWDSTYWSLFVSLFVLTSPLIVFYTPNFLTDITALSFTIWGWSYFLQFSQIKTNRKLIISFGLFALAALFKISAAVSLLGIFGIFILEFIGAFKKQENLFTQKWKHLLYFFSTILVVISWYIYAEHYNSIHGGKYTFNSLWPLWELDELHYNNAIKFFKEITIFQLFNKIVLASLFLLTIIALIITFIKNRKVFFLLVFILFGYTCYIVFWFGALENHDYYFINLFTLPIIILAINIHYLITSVSNTFSLQIFKVIAFLLFSIGVFYSASNIRLRYSEKMHVGKFLSETFYDANQIIYWNWISSVKRNEGLFTIEKYNRSLGIKESDLVICYPDFTFNYSLFYLNQKGWTTFNNQNYEKEPIEFSIERGAAYLIINKWDLEYNMHADISKIQHFMTDSIGYHKGFTIYRLKK